MNDRHQDLHTLLASLGASSRFRIALCLLEGDRCVGELAREIGLSQSCTTRHLQALERAGVVRSRRDGKRVLVALALERAGLAGVLGISLEASGVRERREAPPTARAAHVAGPRQPRRPERLPSRAASPRAEEAPVEERPPAGAPSSGTPPGPVDAPPVHTRRPHETLEDFLL